MRVSAEASKHITEILRIATAPLTAHEIRLLINQQYDVDYDSSEIGAHLQGFIRHKKAQRHHVASGVLRYSLVGSKAAKAATAPVEPEPAKPSAKGKLEDAVQRGRVVGPCGLKDRLTAIAADLNDAVSDACDLKIDHEVIKALLASQAACSAALQRL